MLQAFLGIATGKADTSRLFWLGRLLTGWKNRKRKRGRERRSRFEPVKPCEQFGHSAVKFGRNGLIEIHLHQQGYEFRRFMHIHPMGPRFLDERFRHQSPALRDDLRSRPAIPVGQRNRGIS